MRPHLQPYSSILSSSPFLPVDIEPSPRYGIPRPDESAAAEPFRNDVRSCSALSRSNRLPLAHSVLLQHDTNLLTAGTAPSMLPASQSSHMGRKVCAVRNWKGRWRPAESPALWQTSENPSGSACGFEVSLRVILSSREPAKGTCMRPGLSTPF